MRTVDGHSWVNRCVNTERHVSHVLKPENPTNKNGDRATRTVENGTNNGAEDLQRECHAGRQLDALAKLQVAQHGNALAMGVLAVQRVVHVRGRVELGGRAVYE